MTDTRARARARARSVFGAFHNLVVLRWRRQQLPMANQLNLQKAWNVKQVATPEDWEDWMRRFSVSLLRESPGAALRACSTLAQVTLGC